jgi:hypothetical protein
MNVVITGGRDFADRDLLFAVLDDIHDTRGPITLIRNGGMTGADALSSRWAYERQVDTECVGALWGQYRKRAGPIRNEWMISRGTDVLVAFPGGRGTANTIEIARRYHHIEVIEVGR